ncbi:MAG: bacterioferritin-associated ferredoxin [Pseudomonadota bacterium]
MYVCVCKGITDQQIRSAVENGASSLQEVRESLGVASQCGTCGILARDIVRGTLSSMQQDDDCLFYAAV